jgi:hypothetical protein
MKKPHTVAGQHEHSNTAKNNQNIQTGNVDAQSMDPMDISIRGIYVGWFGERIRCKFSGIYAALFFALKSRRNSVSAEPIALAGEDNAWDAFWVEIEHSGRIATDGQKKKALPKGREPALGTRFLATMSDQLIRI